MKPRLGGDLKARGGLRHLVISARALGYSAVQTMLGEGRTYEPFDITDEAAEEYKKMTYGIATYVHLPFVLNPCESVPQRKGFYRKAFKRHCSLAASLGARGVVLHPGYKKDLKIEQARKNLIDFIEAAWDESWEMNLLLETDAGSKNGSAIGTPELIKGVLRALDHEQMAMCLDTCHMFARGTNLWHLGTRAIFLQEFQREIRLVHLNVPDPGVELGSHRDRHNTPFEERTDLNHPPLIRELTGRYDCILERSSLAVQKMDTEYIRALELVEE